MSSSLKEFQNLSNVNILVTGWSGFIGTHLIKKLIDLNNNLLILVRDKNYLLPENCLPIYCDLLDRTKLEKSFKNIEIDFIIHLAGISKIGNACSEILNAYNVNVIGFGNIYELAVLKNVKKILMTSSTIVYGNQKKMVIDEHSIPSDNSIYGSSKICSEILAKALYLKYEIPVSICRIGHVYGPMDHNYERLVPSIFNSLIKMKEPNFKSSLDTKIDLLYIDDTIYALLLIMNDINLKFELININSQNSYSIYNIFSKIKRISGSTINIQNPNGNNIRNGFIIKNQKLKDQYKWFEKTSLDEGLYKTFNYYKNIIV